MIKLKKGKFRLFFSQWIASHNLKLSRLNSLRGVRVNSLILNWQAHKLENLQFDYIQKALHEFHLDIKQQLQRNDFLNTSLRKQVYEYYLHKLKSKSIAPISYDVFWNQLTKKIEPSGQVLIFIEEYCREIAIVFSLKQQLLIKHSLSTSFKLYQAYYSNLNTLYSKLFATEIANDTQFLSFKTGMFTWYDPSAYLLYESQQLYEALTHLKPHCILEFLEKYQSEKPTRQRSDMIDLIVKSTPSDVTLNINESAQSSDFLNLIKKSASKFFIQSDSKKEHEFFNLISELFYCFLKIEENNESYGHKDFLKRIRPVLNSRRAIQLTLDNYFFIQGSLTSHFLKKVQSLEGRVYITQLSTSQLFQPGHKDKNESILKKLQVKDHISIESPYNYHVYRYQDLSKDDTQNNSHSYFRVYNIASETQSSSIYKNLEHLQDYITKKETMVYSHKFQQCHIDYFQDIIIDGILMSSTKDSKQMTHPRFFEALTTQCIPLESLFKTTPLKPQEHRNSNTSESLPLIESASLLPPYVLIIKKQYEKQYECEVDIIPGDSYLGYLKDHGHFENQFFALVPKIPQLNISLLRTFFRTQVGKQVCQLCFRGNSHYRTKIKTLLIPKIIGSLKSSHARDNSLFQKIHAFDYQMDSPQVLIDEFAAVSTNIDREFYNFPLTTLSDLVLFQRVLKTFLSNQKSSHIYYVDFYQPQLIAELKSLNTYPLLPRHEDIFLDLKTSKENLELEFNQLHSFVPDEYHENYRLELCHNQQSLAIIYTKKYIYEFMKFLLLQMHDLKLSQVLKSLNLPKEKDLCLIIPSYEIDNSIFHELSKKCDIIIERLFQSYIMHKESDD